MIAIVLTAEDQKGNQKSWLTSSRQQIADSVERTPPGVRLLPCAMHERKTYMLKLMLM
jgi:hypothetical protein